MCEAISSELNGIHLKDKRLNERSKILIETLAADPQASINAAWDGWTETHAAYRFFDNVKVTPEKILQPHIQATKNRIRTQSVVLVVQDTTELDYTKHPPEDLRCLNTKDRFGLYDHTYLAVTTDKLPLGFLAMNSITAIRKLSAKRNNAAGFPLNKKKACGGSRDIAPPASFQPTGRLQQSQR